MSDKKPWKIEYRNEPWMTSTPNGKGDGIGYYVITFEDARYGFISKDAFENQSTGQILVLIEQMLNDAHELATTRRSDES
jgi:hypothetical protein